MSKDVKKVGNWLYGTLSIPELKKIAASETNPLVDTDTTINIEVTLLELQVLRLGKVPERRNCFELIKVTRR